MLSCNKIAFLFLNYIFSLNKIPTQGLFLYLSFYHPVIHVKKATLVQISDYLYLTDFLKLKIFKVLSFNTLQYFCHLHVIKQ